MSSLEKERAVPDGDGEQCGTGYTVRGQVRTAGSSVQSRGDSRVSEMSRSFGNLNSFITGINNIGIRDGICVGTMGSMCINAHTVGADGVEMTMCSVNCEVGGGQVLVSAEALGTVCLGGVLCAVFEVLGFSLPLSPDSAVLSSPVLWGSLDLSAVLVLEVPGSQRYCV